MRIHLAFVTMGLMVLVGCSGRSGGDGNEGGGCDPACTTGQSCCEVDTGDSICRVTGSDPNNCGGCGIICSSGVCMAGECVGDGGSSTDEDGGPVSGDCSPSCSSSQRCCGTTCVNYEVNAGEDGRDDSSFDNCNGCGLACDPERASACSRPAGGGGGAQCRCGAFEQCDEGEVCVDGGSSFRCADTQDDPENCGEPGNACAGEEVCQDGECVCAGASASCGEGTTCCSAGCIDTEEDDNNCGGCGNVCPEGTSCNGGACGCGTGGACDAPSGTDLGEICCGGECVPQDSNNCGTCGTMCDSSGTGGLGTVECVNGTDALTMTPRVCCGIDLLGQIICTDILGGGGLPSFP